MKKHSGKANCPSDNEEILNYCLADGQNEDRSVTFVREINGICVSKIRFLFVCDFHFLSKYNEPPPPPVFALQLFCTLIYQDVEIRESQRN